MAASTYFAQVQQLYIAYFGRPADTIGQAYWANQIDAANGSIASVIAGFSASAESAALFGNKSSIDKVTAIYQNAFGRAPEPAGLAYWVAQLDSGKVSQAQASWTIQQSAGAGDAAAVQNKLTAAQAFTAQIDTTAEITGYQGAAAAESARAFLKTVTADNATATAAVTGAAAAVVAATAVGVVGATYTLTDSTDVLVGTNSNDIFIAGLKAGGATLAAGDSINGGDGIDTLNLFGNVNTAAFAAATVASVEKVVAQFDATAGVLNVSANAGVTEAWVKGNAGAAGATVTLTKAQLAGVTGAVAGAGGAVFTFSDATAAAGDVANVALSAATIAAVSVANVETLNIAATGANSAANSAAIALAATSATKLAFTGAGSVNVALAAGSTKVATIDGSAATGSLIIDNSVATAAVQSIKTGSGNDQYTTKFGDLTKDDKIDLGAGTDTLTFTDAADITTAAAKLALSGVTNVEVLKSVGAVAFAVDGDQVSQTTFEVATTGKATFTNLAQNSTVTLDGVAVDATSSAGLKLGANTLNLNLVGDAANNSNVAGFEVTGSSVVNVNSDGKATAVANVLALTAADNNTIKVTGSKDLTLTTTNKAGVTGLTIDGSSFTGKLAVTGTAQADVIKGGLGDDTITATAGLDTLTGGAGKDTFSFANTVLGTNNVSTITDFTVGDKLDLKIAAAGAFVSTKVDVSGAADLAAAIGLADNTATNVSWFTFGGDTYVVGAGGTPAAVTDDTIVKLAGTLDLSHSTFNAGVVTFA